MRKISTYFKVLYTLLFLIAGSGIINAQPLDWVQDGSDIDGLIANGQSGNAISLSSDGTTIAIGAYASNSNGTNSGQVRIFENGSGSWVQKGQNLDGQFHEWFGKSVSINGTGSIVAIGAHYSDAGNADSTFYGQVKIYAYNIANQLWDSVAVVNGENPNDEAGWSVSLAANDSIVAVGEHFYDDGANADAGRVRIFKYNSLTFSLDLIGTIVGEEAGDLCGQSVALSSDGTVVAVGASLNDGNGSNSGHVRVYKYDSGTTWDLIGDDIDGSNMNDESGHSVSLNSDGTVVAVGAYNYGGAKGQVRVLALDLVPGVDTTWNQMGQAIIGENYSDKTARYSLSLSADGSRVAMGAENYNGPNGTGSGYARVFDYDAGSTSWMQIGNNIVGEAGGDRSGISVSLSADGSGLGIGAYRNDAGGNNAGHVRMYKLKTDAIWNGLVSADWHTAGNWNSGTPDGTTNVVIPAGLTSNYPTVESAAECFNLIIESTDGSTGSILGQSNLTVNGTTIIKRQMTGDAWYLMASPAQGQTISSFLSANTVIPRKNEPGADPRGMMDYNETGNDWNTFYKDGQAGSIGAGKGYALRISEDTTVTFTGALATGTVSPAVTTAGPGWNCVGNPYPSAIFVNSLADGTNNFIDANAANFDPVYTAVYVWEDKDSAYTIVNNMTGAFTAALGQGFMVKANTGITTMSFTTALQTHMDDAVLKSATSTSGIKLIAELSGQKTSTLIKFNENMGNGLDVGCDAGILKSGFDLYTNLVEDNGYDFGLQALPASALDNSEIALGLESKTGGLITFSAETENFPMGNEIVLEDRLLGTFTSLKSGNIYTTTIEQGVPGKGRFYLHTSNSSAIDGDLSNDGFHTYYANDKIFISGQVKGQATATLFDMMGRQMKIVELEQKSLNSISVSDIKSGVYVLNIRYESGSISNKIPVNR